MQSAFQMNLPFAYDTEGVTSDAATFDFLN